MYVKTQTALTPTNFVFSTLLQKIVKNNQKLQIASRDGVESSEFVFLSVNLIDLLKEKHFFVIYIFHYLLIEYKHHNHCPHNYLNQNSTYPHP